MVRYLASEEFREAIPAVKLPYRLAVSNYGRLITFTDDIRDGTLRHGSSNNGYRVLRQHVKVPGKNKPVNFSFTIYRAVAELFLPKPNEDQTWVIHLDHNPSNDHVDNLKFVNMKEKTQHNLKSPLVIAGRQKVKETRKRQGGWKLNSTEVIRLKKRIHDPNRKTRMKILAKEFGISEMQLYRIKRGENWGDIKV